MALDMQPTTLHGPEIVLPNGYFAALCQWQTPFSLTLGSPVHSAPIQPHSLSTGSRCRGLGTARRHQDKTEKRAII
jgi:hypothetical protein